MKSLFFILYSCLLLVFTNSSKISEDLVDDNFDMMAIQEMLPIVMGHLSELRHEVALLKTSKNDFKHKMETNKLNNEKEISELKQEVALLKTSRDDLKHKMTEIEREKKLKEERRNLVLGEARAQKVTINSATSMHKSCLEQELSANSTANSGFFIVADTNDGKRKAKLVYCNFNEHPKSTGYQRVIGYVDVKATPTYFYFQSTIGTYDDGDLLLNVNMLNIGNATSIGRYGSDGIFKNGGIFTVPVDGIYYFAFSGMKDGDNNPSTFHINVNGSILGSAYCATSRSSNAASLHSTLALKKGDRVQMTKVGNDIYDSPTLKTTHFTGYLLEETNLPIV